MHILAATSLLVFAFTPAQVIASVSGGGVKPNIPLPFMEDIKTPEPPAIVGPSLDIRGRAAGMVDAPITRPLARIPGGAGAAPRHVFDHVLTSGSADGVIWARGRTYKASFDARGATYVPFFGSQAPANHPVLFTTRSVSVGSVHLECGATAPGQEGDTVAFAHERFLERWQLTLEGVEQQFVFESLPPTGDLVITIGTETDLEASCALDAIAFSNDLGRVDYGAATAIDALGRRFAMSSSFANGTIELRLDRSDLARATLPLVVDPVVTTFPMLNAALNDFAPDVAYDAATDRYLIVYEEAYSDLDHDIYAELRDSVGNYVSADYIDYTTDYWESPRVANNAIGVEFMCVAAVGGFSNLRTIKGRLFSPVFSTMSNQFTIAGSDGYDKSSPDVGGDPAPLAPTYFFVVWERAFSASDHDIHGRLLQLDGSLLGPSTILIDNTSGTRDTRPSISKSNGAGPYDTQAWTIVWQRYTASVGHSQVFAAQRRWNGIAATITYPINATSDVVSNPRVSSVLDGFGPTRQYMVVYEIESLGGDQDVDGLMFEGTHFLVGTNISNYVDITTMPEEQILPCVDSDGRHFTVAYSQSNPNGTENFDVVAADLVYAGDYPYVCESAILASTLDPELDPAITSTYSGGGARRRFLAAWGQSVSQLGSSDVFAAFYDGCEGGFTQGFCFGDGTATGCPCGNTGAAGQGCASSHEPNGASLVSTGNPQVSADTLVLQAAGMGAGSVGLYFQGQPSAGYYGAVFGDGIRCLTAQLRRLGVAHSPMGFSEYPGAGDPSVSVKGMIPAIGAEAFYQVWYRDAGTFCTPSTFNLTNGLRVVWAP